MGKFPILKIFRRLYIFAGVLLLGGGLLVAVEAARISSWYGDSTFDAGIFAITYLYFVGAASVMLIIAEVIQLFLRIEDHLDVIRQDHEYRHKRAQYAASNQSRRPAPPLQQGSS